MSVGEKEIVARSAEVETIERFVEELVDGPAALVLDGVAGIGKTTLWTAGLRAAEARGQRVLQARPTEAEAAFAFAALTDLLGDAFESVRERLPRPQERALAAALLVAEEDEQLDARTMATATLGVLNLLALERPVLVAVDDAQWLDATSRRVLEFVARRLSGPVGLLVAARAEPDDEPPLGIARAFPDERLHRITVGPLSFGAVHHLLHDRIGLSLPRPALSRLVTASGGNPFFALEIARTLARRSLPVPLHEPPPLPSSLRDLVAARIDALSTEGREAAVIVAASQDARIATLHHAMASSAEADAALAEIEAAGVLTVLPGQRVRFTHPLLASAAYETASAERRRALHHRLASLATDPEARGVHLALSAPGADGEAAAAIEEAARHAARRGAQDAAVELFDAACRATPSAAADALARRLFGGAQALDALGEFRAARSLAEQALAATSGAPLRADVLVLLAALDWFDGAAEAATDRVEQALREISGDAGREGPIYARFVRFNFAHDLGRAIRYADTAIGLLAADEHPAAVAHVLIDRFVAGAFRGEQVDPGLLERGVALEVQAAPQLPDGPHPMPLIWWHCVDDVKAARTRFAWEDAWCRERGDEILQSDRMSHLAVAELRAGAWAEAERLVEASGAVAERLEARGPRAMVFEKRALVDAHRGRVERARDTLVPLVEGYEQAGQRWWAALALSTLAFTHRTAGRDEEADAALARMRDHADAVGARDVSFDRSEPYQIDSLLERGDLDAARAALERLEVRARVLPRPWIAAVLPGARALVAAAAGDAAGALTAFDESGPALHLPPFETAWSSFVAGRLRRRLRQKRAAADSLARAVELFEQVGAPTWAARARRELDRVGLRRTPAGELTASESRVAELAASGLTNREIAQAAFMSVKTVEANLARAYRKLGLHSRAELGARLGGTQAQNRG